MTALLYQLPVSLYSFKVRLALAVIGVRVPLVAPHEGTYRSAAYTALVPPGTIPALVSDRMVLTESDAIIEYIDETQGGNRLVGGTPERKARIRMVSRLNDLHLEAQVRALFPHVAPTNRDVRSVADTGARIRERLSLLEWAMAGVGPFAIDHDITMADCGIAATLTWLDALAPLLPRTVKPGPRLSRVYEALGADATAGSEIAVYRPLVAAWVAAKLQS